MPHLVEIVRAEVLTHGHAAIEAGLVAEFCAQRGLVPSPTGAVGVAVAAAADMTELRAALSCAARFDLDDLVMAFEVLVPDEEAKRHGAVFTPEAITSFMATETLRRAVDAGHDPATATVIDPAVGCGALLVAAIRELVTRTGAAPSAVAARVTGVDISSDSIRRARLLIGVTCLTLGDTVEPQPNLVVANALTAPVAAFVGSLRRHTVVLANPPYVRYQDLLDADRVALAARWRACGPGNFNLYFAFFELAAEIVADGGVVAFITPNGFFTSLSGADLREWMLDHDWLDAVVDFGHHRVFDVLTYTAVTFATSRAPRRRPAFAYQDVAGLAGLKALPPRWSELATQVPLTTLGRRPWRLVGPSRATAVAKLSLGRRLDDLADVRFGVATCRDKLFLVSGKVDSDGNLVTSYAGVSYRIEPGLARRCVKVSKVPSAAALAATTTQIIYPYSLSPAGATVRGEEGLASEFPLGYHYLCAIRAELATRDRGRKTYPAWYAYGRSQALVPLGDKLLTPLYAARPRFLFDDDAEALFVNGCAVSARDATDVALLAAVLRSGVCHFYVESISNAIDGGFFAYQKSQLTNLSIPELSDAQLVELLAIEDMGVVDDMLADAYGIALPAAYRR